MPGLRQKKKTETRNNILNAAEAIFLDKGYANATTSEIAKQAGIAEGTIYNYFASKGEILLSLFFQAFLTEPYIFNNGSPGQDDFTTEIMNFLDHYLSPVKDMNKALLREVFAAIYRHTTESTHILTELIRFDQGIIDEGKTYLLQLQQENMLSSGIDLDTFLEIAYGIVMVALSKYIIIDEMSYEAFFEDLETKLGYLVHSALVEPGV